MVILIHGDNDFQSEILLKRFIGKKQASIIQADEAKSLSDLVFTADSFDLFGQEKSLTVLKNISKNRKKTLHNELATYLETGHQRVEIILFENKKFDARTKLYKTIQKLGEIKENKVLEINELSAWIVKILKNENIEADKNYVSKIIDKVGYDQRVLSSEIIKLITLLKASKRNNIIDEDLSLLTENREYVIWDLVDSISKRDKKTALDLLEGLYTSDADFSYLIAMIAKQIKMLYWLSSGVVSEQSMTKDLKVHSFTMGKLKSTTRNFNPKSLKMLYSKITSLDFKVKQGKIEPKLGLVLLISSV